MASGSSSDTDTRIKFHRIKSQDNKPLNLFTGLYYRITVKSIPNGIVTYELEPREEGHLIQLALNYVEDFDPDGDLRSASLWTILPETSNSDSEPPSYQIKVMSHPEGNLTYTHGTSWGGRYMELDLKNPEHYDPGSTMHSSALWHFNPSEFPDYFTIHNSDERRNPNFVTFSNEPSDRGQLMQIGTKDFDNYGVKGPFRQDALWSFKPANYKLSALVTNFEFQEIPSDSEISEEAYPIGIMDEVVITEEDTKINFSQEIPDTFALCFLQSFKIFDEECVTIDSSNFSKIPFLAQKPKILPFEKKSNTQWTCTVGTEYKIQQEFKLPEGVGWLKVKGYCSVVKELEIPFTAIVEVSAKADVADCEDGGVRKEMVQVFNSEIIENFLRIDRFTGKVLPKVDKKKKSMDSEGTNTVLCQVNGRLKCTCGLDTYVNVKVGEAKLNT